MKAYRTYATVSDPKKLVLTDLPFEPGQRVEALLLACESNERESVGDLRALCAATRDLPQVEALTDEEIDAEIKAYRDRR
jgi:hypothetical protein